MLGPQANRSPNFDGGSWPMPALMRARADGVRPKCPAAVTTSSAAWREIWRGWPDVAPAAIFREGV
jgi:hypothetical protein